MLEHQERIQAEKQAGPATLPLPKSQLDIPLIGAVRRSDSPAPTKSKGRRQKAVQPRLGGI
jgi:hypothetical protein